MKLIEPPSSNSASTITFIGRNSRGHWIAKEQHGLYGGLFINRAEALKYALFENGHLPGKIVELAREFELDVSGASHKAPHEAVRHLFRRTSWFSFIHRQIKRRSSIP